MTSMKIHVIALALFAVTVHADELAQPRALCSEAIASTLKDPPSLRIEGMHTGLRPGEYNLMVNAKNSYGGYTGAKPFVCQLSADGKRVLKVKQFGT